MKICRRATKRSYCRNADAEFPSGGRHRERKAAIEEQLKVSDKDIRALHFSNL
jgi:hypothetical protein